MQEQEIVKYLQNSPFTLKEGKLRYTGDVKFGDLTFNFNQGYVILSRYHAMSERDKHYHIELKDLTNLQLCHKNRTLIISMNYKGRPRKFSMKLIYNELQTRKMKKEFMGYWGQCVAYDYNGRNSTRPDFLSTVEMTSDKHYFIVSRCKYRDSTPVVSRFHIFYEDIKKLEFNEKGLLEVTYFTNGMNRVVEI